MPRPSFDPHPYGCPLCLLKTPAEMREAITEITVALLGVIRPTVHVVNPSRGASYPILNLLAPDEEVPRIVLFPAWEDNNRQQSMAWARQASLLQRIHEARVPPGNIGDFSGGAKQDGLIVPLGGPGVSPVDLVGEIGMYLADLCDLRVAEGPRVPVVRLYAEGEDSPRITFVSGWHHGNVAPSRKRQTWVEKATDAIEVDAMDWMYG